MPNLAGAYTFTLTSHCRTTVGTLPDAATRRTYAANVSQDQRWLTVVLSGAVIGDCLRDAFDPTSSRATRKAALVDYADQKTRAMFRRPFSRRAE